MCDVARRSGMGRATVYRLFVSKDDLLEPWFWLRCVNISPEMPPYA
ncbi:helix-turn-helix domain-containing protein [Rhodococcus sp. G-MC3]